MFMTEDEGLTKTEDASAEDDDYDFFGETTEDEEGEAEEDTGNVYLEDHEQAIKLTG